MNGAVICRGCEQALADALAAVGWLAPALDEALARQVTFAERAGRGSGRPLPFDERAADAAAELRNELAGWVRVLVVTAADTYPADSLAAMASRLVRWMDRVRQHEAADQIVAGVIAAVDRAKRAIDRPPGRVYAGPCPQCGADLLGWPGEATIACEGCGAGYDVAERQGVMRAQLEDVLGTAGWCASAAAACGLHVSDGTIRVWASRRRLETRPGGLYRFGDVVSLVLERDTARAG